jgi:large subunit ribosomal protein L32
MAVPKRKHSNSRTNKRRSHDRLTARQLIRCPQCSMTSLPHTICSNCGHYMGRPVVASKAE